MATTSTQAAGAKLGCVWTDQGVVVHAKRVPLVSRYSRCMCLQSMGTKVQTRALGGRWLVAAKKQERERAKRRKSVTGQTSRSSLIQIAEDTAHDSPFTNSQLSFTVTVAAGECVKQLFSLFSYYTLHQ